MKADGHAELARYEELRRNPAESVGASIFYRANAAAIEQQRDAFEARGELAAQRAAEDAAFDALVAAAGGRENALALLDDQEPPDDAA